MKKVKLIIAWGADRKAGQKIYLHKHDFYELVHYSDGEGTSTVAGCPYPISPHTVVLIPPNVEHEEHHTKDGTLFCIGFRCDEIFTAEILKDYRATIQAIVQTIVEEVVEQPALYREMAELKLRELLLQIKRISDKHTKTVTKDFEYVIGYIRQNYHERIVLKDIAKQLHLSYDYFQHRFKEIVGESPQQFLMHKRLEEAERLLREGNFSCTEIAQRCGFANSAQFSMMFKKDKKMSPSKYQQT